MKTFTIQVHYYRVSKGQQEKDFDFLEIEAMCYKSALIKAKEVYGVQAFAYYYNDVKYKNQDICQF
jgi:hypothetical protein